MMDGLLRKYFVLRPRGPDWHGLASRRAMLTYARVVKAQGMPQLAKDIRDWVAEEEKNSKRQ